jgi:1-acyl-sn-glycerol-3-phosphate acyltransferase
MNYHEYGEYYLSVPDLPPPHSPTTSPMLVHAPVSFIAADDLGTGRFYGTAMRAYGSR